MRKTSAMNLWPPHICACAHVQNEEGRNGGAGKHRRRDRQTETERDKHRDRHRDRQAGKPIEDRQR